MTIAVANQKGEDKLAVYIDKVIEDIKKFICDIDLKYKTNFISYEAVIKDFIIQPIKEEENLKFGKLHISDNGDVFKEFKEDDAKLIWKKVESRMPENFLINDLVRGF